MGDQIGFIIFMVIVFVILLAITTVLYHFLVGKTISLEHTISTVLTYVRDLAIGASIAGILYYLGFLS